MGCLKAIVVRVVSTIIIGVLIVLAIMYHRQILDYVDAWRGRKAQYSSAGRDSNAVNRLRVGNYTDLTAPEVAGLISQSLGNQHTFDSIQVALLDNEVRVRGSLDLRNVPRSMLGPFASALNEREPVTIGGPLSVDSTGQLLLTVTYLTVKDFPFPKSTIPRLLQALRIPGVSGSTVPLPFPTKLGDVRVTPEHVRFYRAQR